MSMRAAKGKKRLSIVAAATLLLVVLLALPAGAALPRMADIVDLVDIRAPVAHIAPAPSIAATSILPATSAVTPRAGPARARLRVHIASPPSWPFSPARVGAFGRLEAKNRVWGFDFGLSEQRLQNQWFNPRIAEGVHNGPSMYQFAGYSPANKTDPLGLSCPECRWKGGRPGNVQVTQGDKEFVSGSVGMVPIVGDVKDWQEVFSGVDLITGEGLSGFERGLTAGAGMIPFLPAKAVRAFFGKLNPLRWFRGKSISADSALPHGFDLDTRWMPKYGKGILSRNGSRTLLKQARGAPTCVPTSCGMILDDFFPDRLETRIPGYPGASAAKGYEGILPQDTARLIRANGFPLSRPVISLTIDDLRKATSRGKPAVARIWTYRADGSRGKHAIVVDGVTTRLGVEVVAIRNPWGRQYFQTVEEFKKIYRREAIILEEGPWWGW